MRAAIIIPARRQSTRIPDKLLLAETGRPLICHTVERAAAIRAAAPEAFSHVIVAADDAAIIAAVTAMERHQGLDVRAVMTDPRHQSGSDRIAEAARLLPEEVDAILNLQGDEPDIPGEGVLALAEHFQKTKADIATLVYPVCSQAERDNPSLVKAVLGVDGRALYFSRADIPCRRDDGLFAPPSYGHVGIYLYRRTSLERFVSLPPGMLERTEKLEQLRALENGMSISALILETQPPKGIDSPMECGSCVLSIHGSIKG